MKCDEFEDESLKCENYQSLDKLNDEDSALEDYFEYIESLSRDDLLTLLKWEICNRVYHIRSLESKCQKTKK